MKNIIIRSGMSPLDIFDPAYMIVNNSIGSNVGNLVYAYSVYRTLMTEDISITPDYYVIDHNKADEINEKYDCYIIPLADAFRESFAPFLVRYTKLIKKLKIPVVIIGTGLRAPFEPNLDEGFPYDQEVKEFISAVLDKSSVIGLRGEITSQYLTKLGFKEGIHHKVIGCPSMYALGRELNIRKTNITRESKVSVNSSYLSPNEVLNFINRSIEEYPNYIFIPQWLRELRLTYIGKANLKGSNEDYPVNISHSAYEGNHVRYPLNVPTWIDMLKDVDLSYGSRLHGNITSVIAGTPSILLAKDARMRELAEYHGLTHLRLDEITEDLKLSDVIEKVDFQQPTRKQAENFDNYIDFLNQNELDHLYKETLTPERILLDEKISQVDLNQPLTPINSCNTKEAIDRWDKYNKLAVKKSKDQGKIKVNKEKSKYKQLEKKLADKEKKIKRLETTVNKKSVQMALKIANPISKAVKKLK